MADDLGWMDLHCQGNDALETPHLDRLSSQGMRFTRAYSAAPVCTPTRAAMMTGKSPARLGITNHAPGHPEFRPEGSDLLGAEWTTYLALEEETLAERLTEAGYATGFIGKWHLSHRPGEDQDGPYEPRLRPEHQGFGLNVGGFRGGGPPSYFEPYRIPNIEPRRTGEYLPYRLADESIAFLEAHREEPFFLCWWNYAVHWPLEAPGPLIEKYKPRVGPGILDHRYAAMLEAMDMAIGRVLAKLDELELTSDTLVIFTSDNGSYNGDNRPLRGGKGFLFEGGIRVPLIVRWPGVVEPGTICSTPVISTDTHPTLLEVAGLEPRPGVARDGESLLPLLKQSGELERQALFFHYPNYAFHGENRLGGAILEGDRKLIERYDDGSLELYDLAKDIGETHNLATELPEVARKLKRQLDEWLEESGARMPTRVLDK